MNNLPSDVVSTGIMQFLDVDDLSSLVKSKTCLADADNGGIPARVVCEVDQIAIRLNWLIQSHVYSDERRDIEVFLELNLLDSIVNDYPLLKSSIADAIQSALDHMMDQSFVWKESAVFLAASQTMTQLMAINKHMLRSFVILYARTHIISNSADDHKTFFERLRPWVGKLDPDEICSLGYHVDHWNLAWIIGILPGSFLENPHWASVFLGHVIDNQITINRDRGKNLRGILESWDRHGGVKPKLCPLANQPEQAKSAEWHFVRDVHNNYRRISQEDLEWIAHWFFSEEREVDWKECIS